MNFLKKEDRTGGLKRPSFSKMYDPYENSGSMLKVVRKEVILPGVTSFEERRLSKIHDYIKEKTGKESTLPQHMINDIYSMYVNKDIKKKKKTKYNAIKHKVIDSAYNSLTKMISRDSVLFSQIVAREVSLYMQEVQDLIEEEMKDENGEGEGTPGLDQEGEGDYGDDDGDGDDSNSKPQQGNSSGGKGGNGAGKTIEDKVDDIINKSKGKLDKAMKDAEKEINEIESLMGKDAAKELSDTNPNFLEEYQKLKELLRRISINKESIKNVLVKILNKSQNYFSKNSITVEESIFDAEEIEELFGLENLHPIFRNAGILEVGNESKIYTGKIDLYLDCSGSMSSSANFGGANIRMSELVKGIALVLYKMGMIDKLYFFDDSIYQIENVNEMSILGFNRSGGTDFDKVVKQSLTNKRNSVVITDGEDGCSLYAKNIFWIGVGGTRFQNNDEFKTYRALRQCVTYNSSTSNFDYCK